MQEHLLGCIFCAAKIRNSAIPDPCNKALIAGYECLPHHQEHSPIPSYSLCPTCKEERKPRRRRKEPASVSTMVPETVEGEQMKEKYIWNWIPTPMANDRLSQPVELGDERFSRECEGDEESHGLGLSRSDPAGLSRQLCMTVTGQQGNEGSSVPQDEGESLQVSRPSSSSSSSTAGSSHYQSFIPVPVHRAQGQRMVRQVGGQRSNNPYS